MALVSATIALPLQAKDDAPRTLFTNVHVFDGTNEARIENANVLIEGNLIKTVSTKSIPAEGATVIDGGGRTLMPGFIYAHEHIMMQASSPELLLQDDRYMAILSTKTARMYLDRGITTIRDAAGNSYGLKAAIDKGLVPGPRIYPSGPMISQTSGHADHRFPTTPTTFAGGSLDVMVTQRGDFIVADGVPELLRATRENLRRGSSQIKIAVGGGTGSISDPLEVTEFLPEEISAVVQAAGDFGTYVMAHVYNSHGIRRAVDAGVKCIEHANLIDKETLQYMKDKGVWLSPQVSVYTFIPPGYTEGQAAKHRQAHEGIDAMFKAAKEIGFENIVFGSDIISSPDQIEIMLGEFEKRAQWFTPVEILRQATSKGGELMALSNVMNPYPGKLGVIENGAHADLLLIEGDPLKDVKVILDFENNIDLIMKDGKIYKNSLK
ncbi:MAG: amidohydrolase family protein [Rhodobacteraceae bacterium]|nr:amidohydrolase family protein [Paracoccaceae bacterium]